MNGSNLQSSKIAPSQFADGGLMATRPYIGSSKYILKIRYAGSRRPGAPGLPAAGRERGKLEALSGELGLVAVPFYGLYGLSNWQSLAL